MERSPPQDDTDSSGFLILRRIRSSLDVEGCGDVCVATSGCFHAVFDTVKNDCYLRGNGTSLSNITHFTLISFKCCSGMTSTTPPVNITFSSTATLPGMTLPTGLNNSSSDSDNGYNCSADYVGDRCEQHREASMKCLYQSKRIFMSDFLDHSSVAYEQMERQFLTLCRLSMKTFYLTQNVPAVSVRCALVGFRPGSVIATLIVSVAQTQLLPSTEQSITAIQSTCDESDICVFLDLDITYSNVEANPNLCTDSASNVCSENAMCTFYGGVNYTCKCKAGFRDDNTIGQTGITCTRVCVAGLCNSGSCSEQFGTDASCMFCYGKRNRISTGIYSRRRGGDDLRAKERQRLRTIPKNMTVAQKEKVRQQSRERVRRYKERKKQSLTVIDSDHVPPTPYKSKAGETKVFRRALKQLPQSETHRNRVVYLLVNNFCSSVLRTKHTTSPSRPRVSEETRELVREFNLREDVSMVTPGRKDYVPIISSEGTSIMTQMQKQYLLANLRERT